MGLNQCSAAACALCSLCRWCALRRASTRAPTALRARESRCDAHECPAGRGQGRAGQGLLMDTTAAHLLHCHTSESAWSSALSQSPSYTCHPPCTYTMPRFAVLRGGPACGLQAQAEAGQGGAAGRDPPPHLHRRRPLKGNNVSFLVFFVRLEFCHIWLLIKQSVVGV